MRVRNHGTRQLMRRIETLHEPYRENAVAWLRECTQSPLDDLERDMDRFLDRLHPAVRARFLLQARRLLDTAIHYFGE